MVAKKLDVFVGKELMDADNPFWIALKGVTEEEAAFIKQICVPRDLDVLIRLTQSTDEGE